MLNANLTRKTLNFLGFDVSSLPRGSEKDICQKPTKVGSFEVGLKLSKKKKKGKCTVKADPSTFITTVN